MESEIIVNRDPPRIGSHERFLHILRIRFALGIDAEKPVAIGTGVELTGDWIAGHRDVAIRIGLPLIAEPYVRYLRSQIDIATGNYDFLARRRLAIDYYR